MLQKIRDSLQGWIAYAIVAVLVVPFALWGIGDYLGFFGETYAAKVNDTEIPMRNYRQAYNQRYSQLREFYGDQFSVDMIDEASLRREVIDRMITEEVLYQYADKLGFRISSGRLRDEIHSIEAFHENGVFSRERYEYLLQLSQQTPTQFETAFARSLVVGQLEQSVIGTSFMPDAVVEDLIRVADQRREFTWIDLPAAEFADAVAIDDDAVIEYYERNRERFMTEESVDIAYVEMTTDTIAAGITPSEQALREFYQERRRQIAAAEERFARHIMIATDVRDDDEAMALAAEVRARIDAGEDFEALARELSEDPGSAEEGGELGWIERGGFFEELESALFALEPGWVSEPVQSGFGWHLLRVDEVRTTELPEFEDMREELAAEYRQREGERRFYESVERLADLAYENPDSLVAVEESLGLEIGRVEGVTRNRGDGIAGHGRVRTAAFSTTVLEERYNSQLIELDGGHVVVVRVERHDRPELRPLEEVAGQVRDSLMLSEARRLAAEAAERIVERARDGDSLMVLAVEFGGEWHPSRLVGRGNEDLPPELLQALFRTPRPDDGERPVRALRIGANDHAVFQLLSVVPGSPEALEPEDIAGTRAALAQRRGSSEFNALVAELRDRAKISYGSGVFEDPAF